MRGRGMLALEEVLVPLDIFRIQGCVNSALDTQAASPKQAHPPHHAVFLDQPVPERAGDMQAEQQHDGQCRQSV